MTELISVTRGVWRPSDQVDDLAGRCAALLTAVPEGTVVGGMAAAVLHGLWLPNDDPPKIDLLLRNDASQPRERAACVRPEIRGRRRLVRADEVTVLGGLPVTSEVRTWVDLAEVLRPEDLVAAGDSVLRGVPGSLDLAEMVRRSAGRRGVRRARGVLPLLDARSRSRPESHLRFALTRNGLPAPEVNMAIYTDDGEWLAEPDLHYRDARLALEYNGALHADPGRMRRDITRALDVQRGDWLTLTFGPAEVFARPDEAAALVRHYLRRRLPSASRSRPRVATLTPSGEV